MSDNPVNTFDFSKLTLDARPDTIDFRDKMYVPTLVEVPTRIELEDYQAYQVPILNQYQEGACTGFGLATVANYLLRRRKITPDPTPISPRMFYEMAKRYDEWPGKDYQGSSARGAMKGWHKHGVCSAQAWPYTPGSVDRVLTNERASDALRRPLGAYFRVNHKDLVAMHSALAEVGILYTTSNVHEGWEKTGPDGLIPYKPGFKIVGGHAFAIVAYNEYGLWLQNSWGETWGKNGFARISYDDWLANGTDMWVARLGVFVSIRTAEATATNTSPGARQSQSYTYSDLRPHIISLDNDGHLKYDGTYGTNESDLEAIFKQDIPRITQGWDKKRIFLYAHGGLVGETGFIQRVAEYRSTLMKVQVYPIAFVWHSDFWSTVTDILQDAVKHRRPEGILGNALDFMLDRLDDTLEPLVRILNGKILWDEMKENARAATTNSEGGARLTLKHLAELMESDPTVEVHIAGHSAGSIFHAPLVQLFTTQGKIKAGPMKGSTGFGLKITSAALWAPGITVDEFKQTYLPAIQKGSIERFSLFTLSDHAEQGDQCANIYHKSLLYMVSNALEEQRGQSLLGMEKFVQADPDLMKIFRPPTGKGPSADWITAPNEAPEGSLWASRAHSHGDFDDDSYTLESTLARILKSVEKLPEFKFKRTTSSLRDRRKRLE
jgi:hypothetical protein